MCETLSNKTIKCEQCNSRAMYLTGDQAIPLCLDCYCKFAQIHQQMLENTERMLNYTAQAMSEEAASWGVPVTVPQLPPRPRPMTVTGMTLLNINTSNSVVGTINTGSIGSIDQSISALKQTDNSDLAEAVKSLAEAILRSDDLLKHQKNELIESLNVISREAVKPGEMRQNTVALTLLEKAMRITSVTGDIADICQKWWPVLQSVFLR